MFNYSELFSMAECLFCTRGPFCTGSLLHETLLHKRHFSMRGPFSRCHFCKSGQFCTANILHERLFSTEGHFCTIWIFCTATLLNGGSLVHGVNLARQNFCSASAIARRCICIARFLQSVTFARRYNFTEIFIHYEISNNRSILNEALVLQAYI